MHVNDFIYFFPRLECWQYVKIDTLSWQKTLKKLTRLSSKKMSKSMNSTSKLQEKVSRCTLLSLIYVCLWKWPLRSSYCDLHKLMEKLFWFYHCRKLTTLENLHYPVIIWFVCFLQQFWLIKIDPTVVLRHLLNLCTHLRHNFKNH